MRNNQAEVSALRAIAVDFDPIIGSPFDSTELRDVQSSGNLELGQSVQFPHVTQSFVGKIVYIGENAQNWDGATHVALLIRRDDGGIYLKKAREVKLHQ
jgi:hypothetical protein